MANCAAGRTSMKSFANTFFRNAGIDKLLLLSPLLLRADLIQELAGSPPEATPDEPRRALAPLAAGKAGATTATPVARPAESRFVA
jgi:hypothetical protein